MIAAAAVQHCCDGEELRVPGSPQPYARRVRGSWRDYLEPPNGGSGRGCYPVAFVGNRDDDSYDGDSIDGDDDDDDDDDEDDDDDDEDSYDDDDVCSCCSLCSSGGCGRDTPPTSSYTSSSSSSRCSSLAAAAAAIRPRRQVESPVFEPSMRGSCRCIRCQKRRYSLDFFKSTDFRRGVPSSNVYMLDERVCKIVDDYIHGKLNILTRYYVTLHQWRVYWGGGGDLGDIALPKQFLF